MNLKVAGLVQESIVDGPGIRFTLFTQGCPHHCMGCHNPHTHDFNQGYLIEIDTLVKKICSNPYLDGLTISGGEPFMQIKELNELLQSLPAINTIIYTGYLFEDLLSKAKINEELYQVLEKTDYLIDGKFIAEQKDLTLKYRGSKNQRIIDCKKSLLQKAVVIAKF